MNALCAVGPAVVTKAMADADLGATRAYLAHMRAADASVGPSSAAWVEGSMQAAREAAPGDETRLMHTWLSVRVPSRPSEWGQAAPSVPRSFRGAMSQALCGRVA